jgi:hypothetical protein
MAVRYLSRAGLPFIFCFILGSTYTTAQQSNATLSETVQWLKNTPVQVITGVNVQTGSRDILLKGGVWHLDGDHCSLSLSGRGSSIQYYEILDSGLGRSNVSFSLSDIDPGKFKVDDRGNLTVYASENKPAFKLKSGGRVFTGSHLSLGFDDAEMARRTRNALEHAVTLCGGKPGKKEPF